MVSLRPVLRALLALLALLALAPAASVAAPPKPGNEFVATEAYIPTSDPTIRLHADVMLPRGHKPGERLPVILSIGPYFNHSHQAATDIDPLRDNAPQSRFDDLINEGRIFEKGYALVYVDLPGFGGSSGCNDFGGPNERMATRTAVEWAAKQSWSTGRVGMWGKSYDGWTQVMALAEKPAGLAATVIQAPIIDGYRTLYQNGIHYDLGWYITPALYQAIDVLPPTVNEEPDYFVNWALGENAACYAANIALQTALIDKDDAAGFWKARDLVDKAKANSEGVAVLWSHGFLDENTKPDNFLDVFEGLKGPRRGFYGQFAHDRGNEDAKVGRTGGPFMAQAMRWFAEHLKGEAGAAAADAAVEVADSDGRWRTESQWPPADMARIAMPLKDGSYVDDDRNGAGTAPTGVGSWTFTQPMANVTRLAGVPRVTVTATTDAPRAALVALLYDYNPATGRARLITRGAKAVKGSGPVTFELFPQDYRVRAGNRLGLLLAGNDKDFYLTAHSGRTVSVKAGSLSLPVLGAARTEFLTSAKATPAMGSVPSIPVAAETVAANTVEAPGLG